MSLSLILMVLNDIGVSYLILLGHAKDILLGHTRDILLGHAKDTLLIRTKGILVRHAREPMRIQDLEKHFS
jgi:hypothetical protein